MTRSRNDMEASKQNDSNANHTQEGCESQAVKEGKKLAMAVRKIGIAKV